MAKLQIEQFICRGDNYGVLIHDEAAGVTAAIDTPEAAPIRAKLAEKGWRLTHILTTHHHGDHVAGHLDLKAETGCKILGGGKDAARIPGLDTALDDGASFMFGSFEVNVFDTPGHTLGHIGYHIPGAGVAFLGDTLFSLGCGRLLEGTADDMWASLQKIQTLPADTLIYCGHEYTVANAKFALSVEPENAALQARAREVERLRKDGAATLPVRLSDEQDTNPFLRPQSEHIQTRLGMAGLPYNEIFAKLRKMKDSYS